MSNAYTRVYEWIDASIIGAVGVCIPDVIWRLPLPHFSALLIMLWRLSIDTDRQTDRQIDCRWTDRRQHTERSLSVRRPVVCLYLHSCRRWRPNSPADIIASRARTCSRRCLRTDKPRQAATAAAAATVSARPSSSAPPPRHTQRGRAQGRWWTRAGDGRSSAAAVSRQCAAGSETTQRDRCGRPWRLGYRCTLRRSGSRQSR